MIGDSRTRISRPEKIAQSKRDNGADSLMVDGTDLLLWRKCCHISCVHSMLLVLQSLVPSHNDNLPMQYTEIFSYVKNENFSIKSLIVFLAGFAQNIDRVYT